MVAGHHLYVLESPQAVVTHLDRTICRPEVIGCIQAEKAGQRNMLL